MIKKFETIDYKSYSHYQWGKYAKKECKSEEGIIGKETKLQKYNLFYGDNGSGKSSICDIFKYLDDPSVHPLKNGNFNFVTNTNQSINDSEDFEFGIDLFDLDYIGEYVHVHGIKNENKGGHEEKAGKLIVGLDAKLNQLYNSEREKKDELKRLKEKYSSVKSLSFDNEQISWCEYLKRSDLKQADLNDWRSLYENKVFQLTENLNVNDDNLSNIDRIENLTLKEQPTKNSLPKWENIEELLSIDLIQVSNYEAYQEFEEHFKNHSSFLTSNFENTIKQLNPSDECPICKQSLKSAKAILDFYHSKFDSSYRKKREEFRSAKKTIIDNFQEYELFVNIIEAWYNDFFDELEVISNQFKIDGIYNKSEKLPLNVPKDQFIYTISEIVSNIKSLSGDTEDSKFEDLKSLYKVLENHEKVIEEFYFRTKKQRTDKIEVLKDFQEKNKDEDQIRKRNRRLQKKLVWKEQVLEFINEKTFQKYINWCEFNEIKQRFEDDLKKINENIDIRRKQLPEDIAYQMEDVVNNHFNLDLKITLIDKAKYHKEVHPFSFEITDLSGEKRDLKKGLSEGERQIISFAFFYATINNMESNDKRFLLLDDPVSSLDSSNLKLFANLIVKVSKSYKQVFVFTHHQLFFKYLGKQDFSPFQIVKNKQELGGSLIFKHVIANFDSKLREFQKEKIKGRSLDLLKHEYGMYLRLSIERLIKKKVFNVSDNLREIFGHFKKGKTILNKLDEKDFDTLKSIYDFCNWSNVAHEDIEEATTILELERHIEDYLLITEKL